MIHTSMESTISNSIYMVYSQPGHYAHWQMEYTLHQRVSDNQTKPFTIIRSTVRMSVLPIKCQYEDPIHDLQVLRKGNWIGALQVRVMTKRLPEVPSSSNSISPTALPSVSVVSSMGTSTLTSLLAHKKMGKLMNSEYFFTKSCSQPHVLYSFNSELPLFHYNYPVGSLKSTSRGRIQWSYWTITVGQREYYISSCDQNLV